MLLFNIDTNIIIIFTCHWNIGALMSFNGNILALFDQLGMLEEAMSISFKIHSTNLFDEKLNKLAEVNTSDHHDR